MLRREMSLKDGYWRNTERGWMVPVNKGRVAHYQGAQGAWGQEREEPSARKNKYVKAQV